MALISAVNNTTACSPGRPRARRHNRGVYHPRQREVSVSRDREIQKSQSATSPRERPRFGRLGSGSCRTQRSSGSAISVHTKASRRSTQNVRGACQPTTARGQHGPRRSRLCARAAFALPSHIHLAAPEPV